MADMKDPEQTQDDKDEESTLLEAVDLLLSQDASVRKEGAKTLSVCKITAHAAKFLANSGVLPAICEMMAEQAEHADSHLFLTLCEILFSAGAHKDCAHKAGHALAQVLRGGMADGHQVAAQPNSARPYSARTAGRSSAMGGVVVSPGKYSRSTGGLGADVHGPASNGTAPGAPVGAEKLSSGKFNRDVLFLGPIGLPCHSISREESVGFVELGSMMWVYPPKDERGKPFEAYVQLLPSGHLFVGGMQQKVVVTGAQRGCSEHVKERFKLTTAQRKGAFRIKAIPSEGYTGHFDQEGHVFLDLRLHSISDMLIWVKGVSAVTEVEMEELGGGEHETTAADGTTRPSVQNVIFDGRLPERKGNATYEGERDVVTCPCCLPPSPGICVLILEAALLMRAVLLCSWATSLG